MSLASPLEHDHGQADLTTARNLAFTYHYDPRRRVHGFDRQGEYLGWCDETALPTLSPEVSLEGDLLPQLRPRGDRDRRGYLDFRLAGVVEDKTGNVAVLRALGPEAVLRVRLPDGERSLLAVPRCVGNVMAGGTLAPAFLDVKFQPGGHVDVRTAYLTEYLARLLRPQMLLPVSVFVGEKVLSRRLAA